MPGKKIKILGFKDSRPNEDPSVQDASPVKAKCGATRGFADSRPDVEAPPQERAGVDGYGHVRVADVLTLPVHKDLDLRFGQCARRSVETPRQGPRPRYPNLCAARKAAHSR